MYIYVKYDKCRLFSGERQLCWANNIFSGIIFNENNIKLCGNTICDIDFSFAYVVERENINT